MEWRWGIIFEFPLVCVFWEDAAAAAVVGGDGGESYITCLSAALWDFFDSHPWEKKKEKKKKEEMQVSSLFSLPCSCLH